MAEDPLAQPTNPPPAVAATTLPPTVLAPNAAASVPVYARVKAPVATVDDTGEEDSATLPKAQSPLVYAFGTLSVVLLIAVAVLGVKLSVRNRTIMETTNRRDQVQDAATSLQAQVTDAKAETAALQTKFNSALADTAQYRDDLEKVKLGIVEVQARLDQSRAAATAFQTLAEEAKVASLKHQGEVAVAQTQTAVMLEQMTKAKADLAELGAKSAGLQAKLDKAEGEITRLQKPPAKN